MNRCLLALAMAFFFVPLPALAAASSPDAPRPINVPIADLGTRYQLIGKLRAPLGRTIEVEGIVVESRLKESGALLRPQTIDGRPTQEDILITLRPYFRAWGEESHQQGVAPLPKLEIGKTYRMRGYETGGYEGAPGDAYKEAGFIVQTGGYHFHTDFVVFRAEAIDPIAPSPSHVAAAPPAPAAESREKAFADLAGGEANAKALAIDELGQMLKSDPTVATPLLEALFTPPRDGSLVEWDAMKALLNADTLTGAEVIQAFRNSGTAIDYTYDLLVVTLGRMGPKARDAETFLRDQLARPELRARLRGEMLVALANIGCADTATVSAIREGLVAQNDVGAGVVEAMGRMRTGGWATSDIVSALATWLPLQESRNPDTASYAAAALGLLGEKGAPAVDALRRELDLMGRDGDIGGAIVLYGVALARVDTRERSAVLRHTLKFAGSEPGDSRLVYAALKDTAALMEPDLLADVANMLGDKDDEVVVGALRLLSHVGLRAAGAVSLVSKCASSGRTGTIREQAAETLTRLTRNARPSETGR